MTVRRIIDEQEISAALRLLLTYLCGLKRRSTRNRELKALRLLFRRMNTLKSLSFTARLRAVSLLE